MKLSLRLLLGYFAVLGIMGYFLFSFVFDEAKPLVRQSAEEVLIDTVFLLSSIIEHQNPDPERLQVTDDVQQAISSFVQYNPAANIWGLRKTHIDLDVYVTDDKGIVIYDSSGKDEGKDFSQWNDVYLALRGRYGARTTWDDKNNPNTSVMYIAAPIRLNNQIKGVVTVRKPNASINPYINNARRKLTIYSLLMLGLCLLLGLLFVWWFANRLGRLKNYANAVTEGRRAKMPPFHIKDEMVDLAHALEDMKEKLEGKAYVENYVQLMAHEMKSPLTAIYASGEILASDVKQPALASMANNIQQETSRLQQLIDRLLALAKVEKMTELPNVETIEVAELIHIWQTSRDMLIAGKSCQLEMKLSESCFKGNKWLMSQAVNNILDNALKFLPEAGRIAITSQINDQAQLQISIFNEGDLIPNFALKQIFERFYSLPNNHHQQKSTGLGLSLAQEVIDLHQGAISIANKANGVQVDISLTPMLTP